MCDKRKAAKNVLTRAYDLLADPLRSKHRVCGIAYASPANTRTSKKAALMTEDGFRRRHRSSLTSKKVFDLLKCSWIFHGGQISRITPLANRLNSSAQ